MTIATLKIKNYTLPSFVYVNRFSQLLRLLKKEVVVIYSSFFLISLVLVSVFKKQTLHILLNRYHSAFFDVFFKYATFLGDGILFGVLSLVFLFIKRKVAYAFAVSGLVTLLVISFLKKVVFTHMTRPASFFGVENLHTIEGVKMAFHHTFPSGHTTTAFAIFTILSLCFSKCKTQYLWLSLALIAGLSRVYLSQHYWVDVFVGSFLGVAIGFFSMALFYKVKRVG